MLPWTALATIILACALPKSHGFAGYALSSIDKDASGYSGTLYFIGDESEDYGAHIKNLSLQVYFESESYVRVKITDQFSERWEIPQSVIHRPHITPSTDGGFEYKFEYDVYPFSFKIIRTLDQYCVFHFSSEFIFKDQFINFSSLFDEGVLTYGLGESTRLHQALSPGSTFTMWARDVPAANMDVNLYGSYPLYWQLASGNAHGALLMNSNGMDVTLAEKTLNFSVIGGLIDLYVFTGPTPNKVSQQYTAVVGRPALMPYWSLGFHNCRWGYESIAQVEEVVRRYHDAGIPLDTQWLDIDYMQDYKDFTYEKRAFNKHSVANFVDHLHQKGMRYVPILDPGIKVEKGYPAYDRGIELDLFVKDLLGDPYMGQVWPGPTYYPDFLHPDTQKYWTDNLHSFFDMAPFDGLWIDMNEVSNFCNLNGRAQVCSNTRKSGCPTDIQGLCCLKCEEEDPTNLLDFPPYAIHSGVLHSLSVTTIAMSATHYGNVSEYDVHNLYGLTEQIASRAAVLELTSRRPFILSRSSFVSTGSHSAKWTGDNAATWLDLKSSVVSLLDFSMFGVPMVGSDICGFMLDSNEELCARWIEVGAFYPFSRDHSARGTAPQELYLWESVTEAAKCALGMRYELLPYIYSLFHAANSQGSLVVRALWMNFPNNSVTLGIDNQFMLGTAVLVSPVLDQGHNAVNAYFTQGLWYDFHPESRSMTYKIREDGEWKYIVTPLTRVNVHIYGGHVVPLQEPALTTTASRISPFTLLVALSSYGAASGELYWDDGEQPEPVTDYLLAQYSAHVSRNHGFLRAVIQHSTYPVAEARVISDVKVMWIPGCLSGVDELYVNGRPASSVDIIHDFSLGTLTFSGLNISLTSAFTLEWKSVDAQREI